MKFVVKISSKKTNKTCKFICQWADGVNPEQFIKSGSFRSEFDWKMYDNPKTFLKELFKLAIEQGNPIEYVDVNGCTNWERTSIWDKTRYPDGSQFSNHLEEGRLLVKELIKVIL
jgi:hypothetical protein